MVAFYPQQKEEMYGHSEKKREEVRGLKLVLAWVLGEDGCKKGGL